MAKKSDPRINDYLAWCEKNRANDERIALLESGNAAEFVPLPMSAEAELEEMLHGSSYLTDPSGPVPVATLPKPTINLAAARESELRWRRLAQPRLRSMVVKTQVAYDAALQEEIAGDYASAIRKMAAGIKDLQDGARNAARLRDGIVARNGRIVDVVGLLGSAISDLCEIPGHGDGIVAKGWVSTLREFGWLS